MCASMLEIWNHFMIYETIKEHKYLLYKAFCKAKILGKLFLDIISHNMMFRISFFFSKSILDSLDSFSYVC